MGTVFQNFWLKVVTYFNQNVLNVCGWVYISILYLHFEVFHKKRGVGNVNIQKENHQNRQKMFYTHKTECFAMYTELRTHMMAVHTDCVFLVSWFCVFLVLVSTDTYTVETVTKYSLVPSMKKIKIKIYL